MRNLARRLNRIENMIRFKTQEQRERQLWEEKIDEAIQTRLEGLRSAMKRQENPVGDPPLERIRQAIPPLREELESMAPGGPTAGVGTRFKKS